MVHKKLKILVDYFGMLSNQNIYIQHLCFQLALKKYTVASWPKFEIISVNVNLWSHFIT